jgi:hypothetical protein
MGTEPKKLKIVDDPLVRESYANRLISASFDGGAVILTLGAARFLPEHSDKATAAADSHPVHVTARLAISAAAAVELANALNTLLKTLNEIQTKAAVEQKGGGKRE